ncbi:hypothetical protein GF359_10560 [candidate division WOR-3 bacterium]|uniref:4-vinyl reductase 4VR domain-containing protein n=1 Tax=candidate division WOR-3 bacterium TaxID=2052148 RepID=A0A9D5KAQ1_UNCW3|nr:hypothetical protein [candidate division WOR-3 bacterium]MBD3365643.1 hypothetical protein [candidate division WOR-3 bacterium]
MRRTADLWGKYYRPGRIRFIPRGNNAGVFEVTEFAHDPLFCTTMDAWLQVAAKNMGLKNTRVVQTACIHSGDDHCRWKVSWE